MMGTKRGRRWRAVALLLVLAVGLYIAWQHITKVRGAQHVTFNPAGADCGIQGKLRYCRYRAEGGTSDETVYYMHGRNLDEQAWNDPTYFTAMIQAQWQAAGGLPPQVVAVSYGAEWLLTPRGHAAESGLLDDFMAALPRLEARLGKPRRRMLLGESMGGLNVLIAGLSHPAAFAKVAALCPGVYATSPFAPISDLRTAAARTGADPKIIFGIWRLARRYAVSDAEWSRVAPLRLIAMAGPNYPSLYLANGLYDTYGNFEGTQRLAAIARRRGVATEWHPLYGGHCAIDVVSVADFLRR